MSPVLWMYVVAHEHVMVFVSDDEHDKDTSPTRSLRHETPHAQEATSIVIDKEREAIVYWKT